MVPIELYKFHNEDETQKWCFTSGVVDIEFEGDIYLSTTIGRSEIDSKASIRRENLEVSMAVDNPMARKFLQYTPDGIIFLTLFIQSDVGTFVGWMGRLQATKPEKSTIKMVCESVFTSMQRVGLRQQYTRGCRHMLYNPIGCTVDKSLYMETATVILCEGYRVVFSGTIPPGEVGYYTGGIIDLNGAMRGIINHDTLNAFDINDQFPALVEALLENPGGVEVKVYPGCDRSKAMCRTRFMNYENYGGFPEIPLRNPMDGRPIT